VSLTYLLPCGASCRSQTRALFPVPIRRGILQTLVAVLTADAVSLDQGLAADSSGIGVANSCFTEGDCAFGDAVRPAPLVPELGVRHDSLRRALRH
jgi:hypothetical protein